MSQINIGAISEALNNKADDTSVVHKEYSETINGDKTFTATTLAPTPSSATDNSTKIATTAHVVNVLKAIYPVGSVYIGTQSTCPMSAFFGTWTLVSSGKALWTGNGSNGNSTINAGLPNITGYLSTGFVQAQSADGAFSVRLPKLNRNIPSGSDTYQSGWGWDFSASNSNSIYGASSTVQPPAYVVNVWRRTA